MYRPNTSKIKRFNYISYWVVAVLVGICCCIERISSFSIQHHPSQWTTDRIRCRTSPLHQSSKGASSDYNSQKKFHSGMPRMTEMRSLEEALTATYDNLDRLSPRDVSAFWAVVPKFLGGRGPRTNKQQQQQMLHQFDKISTTSMQDINRYGYRDMSTLAISFAKIIDKVNKRNRSTRGSPHQILQKILIGKDSENKYYIFTVIAKTLVSILRGFDARSLSNLIYACGLIEYVLIEDGITLFDVFAQAAIPNLSEFNGQGLSNMLWTYANVGESNSQLFKKIGDHIVKMNSLNEFWPQTLSNIIWAYATLDEQHPKLFKKIADHIVRIDNLNEFWPQALSNTAWAYATAEEQHPKLFKKVADYIVTLDKLDKYKPQELKDLVWAYATVEESHPQLFKKVADHIVATNNLEEFKPQELSNILWAYATAGESHPKVFEKIANHVIQLDNLDKFKPQHVSNAVWAFATARESNPQLFKKVADHIVGLDNLKSFNEQDLSNAVWAYATARESHPHLFKKVADHIIQLPSLDEFKPQALSNTVWAFATARESQPQLFKKLAGEAIKRQHEFSPQEMSNFLWAFATNGQVDEHLFASLVSSVKENLDKYNNQGLINVAWAYSVANVDAPSVFNDDDFVTACLKREEDDFNIECLYQLHQWQLWQIENQSDISLPSYFQEKCYEAFTSQDLRPSKLQDDVVSILSSLGLQPQEEVLMKSGYRIDAVVEVNGKQIAVEVDGPSHFIGREMTGSTILKHRQVAALDGMPVVSIPYWEWNKLKKDGDRKQQYLRSILGI